VPVLAHDGVTCDLASGTYSTPDGKPPKGFVEDRLNAASAPRLDLLASAAALTGQARFVEAARCLLLACTRRPHWTTSAEYERHTNPYPSSSISAARTLRAVGLAYDVLFDHLSEAERCHVRERLVELGLQPTYQDLGDSDALRWPNGYTLLLAGLGVGAVAVHGEADVERYVRRATACAVVFLDLHHPEGGMLESYGYGQAGIEPIVAFLVALERSELLVMFLAYIPGQNVRLHNNCHITNQSLPENIFSQGNCKLY